MAEIDIWLIQEQKDSETPKMSSSPTSGVRVFLVKEEADWILEDDQEEVATYVKVNLYEFKRIGNFSMARFQGIRRKVDASK